MTAIIEREDDGFAAVCPELDIASQGMPIQEARANLIEALSAVTVPFDFTTLCGEEGY